MKKTILHLCADIGSDSYPYACDENYEVIKIGKNIGVGNYIPDRKIHGIIANPVFTQFSNLNNLNKYKTIPDTSILENCLRIIKEANPEWYVIENPAMGKMKDYLGKPTATYHPWYYGSPWTKKMALWGNFNMPSVVFEKWEDVPKNENLYIRPNRDKPGLNFQHKSVIYHIKEFEPFIGLVDSDSALRSLCSQGFARAFKLKNP